jgi:PleD family two-component response regulator
MSAAGDVGAQAMEKTRGRILIVDDDPHAVEILTRMLGREGYACLSASGGAACLDTLEGQSVDVILLDVMMPEMDGLQVCERLRQDERLRAIPVILLTAKDDMETRARGMSLGVSEYLTKPINKRELFTRIEAQLHAREIDRKLSETVAAVTDPAKLR